MRFLRTITGKMVSGLIVLILGALSLSGWLFYHSAKRGLDRELGDRLTSLATVVAALVDADKLLALMPGEEETAMYRSTRMELLELSSAAGVKRIYVFDREDRSVVDTAPFRIGGEYHQLRFMRRTLEQVWRGKASSSFLYRGEDGTWYKSGYAPVGGGGRIRAVVAVEESAEFLSQIDTLRNKVLRTVAAAVLGALFCGVLLSRAIVKPLRKLVAAAQRFGDGDLSSRAGLRVGDEVGFLGRTFDEMAEKVERRAREKDEEVQSLTRLAAGVAHEVRNPLGVIRVAASTLSRSNDQGKAGELLELIESEVEKLDSVVASLLRFAHPKPPSFQKVRINEILVGELAAVESQLSASNITLERHFGIGLPEVRLDPDLFHQVVLNLSRNAAQAMLEGGRLTVSTFFDPLAEKVVISFQDTGEGIPRENLDRLFDPFFTTRGNGTGLGLSTVRKVVKDHGGEIAVRSSPGDGAQFLISLPVGCSKT